MIKTYNTGDFGKAKFRDKYNQPIEAYGTIRKINGVYVIFKDNEDYTFKIDKKKFRFKTVRISKQLRLRLMYNPVWRKQTKTKITAK